MKGVVVDLGGGGIDYSTGQLIYGVCWLQQGFGQAPHAAVEVDYGDDRYGWVCRTTLEYM